MRQEIDQWAITRELNSRPVLLKASFKIRSEERREVIEREWQDVENDVAALLNDIRPSSDLVEGR